MFKLASSMLLILLSSTAFAVVPGSFTYQGQIVKPNGKPLEESSVEFTIEIYSPGAEECLLYSETHILNMDDSNGLFEIMVGTGTRSGTDYDDTSVLLDVFDNTLPMQTPTTCASVGTYTPTSGDSRKVRVTFDEGSGPITVSQDHRVQSVPYAEHASKLDGLDSSDYVQINDGAGQELSQANIDTIFSTANYTELLALLGGTSNQYMLSSPSTAPNFNNQIVEGVASPVDPDDAANKDYVDNNIGGAAADDSTISSLGIPETGHVLYWNGSEWTASAPVGDSTKLPLAGGTMTGGINMGNQDISNGNNITLNGGLGVGTGINSSGAITLLTENELRFGDDDGGANYVGFKAANALAGNQIWTLPTADGTLRQAMTTDASGTLAWTNVALRDGFAGGQTINGGLNASDNLTLDSTANATKGDVLINPTGGNVGIGTTPATNLHVASNSTNAQFFIESINGGDSQGLSLIVDESQNFVHIDIGGTNHSTDRLHFGDLSTGANTISTLGDIGIGTTNPSGRLDVEGGDVFIGTGTLTNASVNEDLSVTGNLEVDGVIYGDGGGLTNIPSSSFGAGSVDEDAIGTDAVGADEIQAGAVGTSEVADNSLTSDDLGTDSVNSDEIAAGAVGSSEVADNSLTTDDLGTDSVDSDEIAAGAVGTSEIADGSIAAADLADDYVNVSGDTMTGSFGIIAGNAGLPGLNVSSDTDTGIFAPAANQLAITTSGSEALRVDATGYVGVGTTSPGYKLDVVGAASFRGTSSQIRIYETDNPTDVNDAWHFSMNGESLITYYEDNSAGPSYLPVLTQLTTGNVGIGTTAPSGKLDVEGGDVFIGTGTLTNTSVNEDLSVTGNLEVDGVIYGDGAGLTNLPSSSFATGSVDSAAIATGAVDSDEIATGAVGSDEVANGSIAAIDLVEDYVQVGGDNMTGTLNMNARNEIRFLDSAGGEYVGFRAPTTVASNVTYSWPDDDAPPPTPNNYVLSSDGSGNLSWAVASAPADQMGNHTASQNIVMSGFWISNDGGNEGLSIDNSGNITISGTIAGNGSLLTNIGAAALAADSVGSSEIATDAVGAAEIATGAVGTDEIANGVITVTDLNTGSIDSRYLRGDTSDTMSGSLTATSFISTSDRRLKMNIENVPGLDTILNMRGVRFDWIESGEPEIGLIAQEVEAVMPELVVTNSEGFKAVKYSNLVSPLIESTKELYGMCKASEDDLKIHDRRIASLEDSREEMQNKIKSLENENNQLKNQLNDMDQRLKALEALIKGRQ